MQKIEYKLRPVTRYIVTRWETESNANGTEGGGSSTHGIFDNAEVAYEVAYALARAEHDRLGWPIGDERICYPVCPQECADAKLAAV